MQLRTELTDLVIKINILFFRILKEVRVHIIMKVIEILVVLEIML